MAKPRQPYRQIKPSGLELLFGESSRAETAQTIPLQSIHLPTNQPRRYFDYQKLQQLADSIAQHGILEPLLVRPMPHGNFELVAGERRYRAASQIALTQVPVVIRELTDEAALQLALIENLQREDLNPLEETEGILQLLSLKLKQPIPEVTRTLYKLQNEAEGKVTHNVMGKNLTPLVEEIFSSLSSMSWESFVKNRLPLLNLPEKVLEALRQGQIAYTKAQAIARVKDNEQQQTLLTEAIANNLSLNQIKERIKKLSQTPTPTTVELTPQQRIKQTLTRLNQTRIWEDSRKKKKLERLLQQLEDLMN